MRIKRDLTDAQIVALIRQLTPAQMQVFTLYLMVKDTLDRDTVIARLKQL